MSETSSSANSLFLNTSPGRLFLLAALPGAISMLASSLYGLLDGIFVGQSLGETAFASLNLAFPFVIINFSLADLIGVGSAVPISINLGMKKDREANNVFSCAVLMIILTGAAIGAFLLFFGIIIRGVAFEYRGLRDHQAWRDRWDWAIIPTRVSISPRSGSGAFRPWIRL